MVLILATTLGVLNLSSRPGSNPPASEAAAKAGTATAAAAAASGPLPRAGTADALDALEPLQRFLNLSTPPSSLEQLASSLAGYRLTTLIVAISDPKDSRLGYDFDMATEAIQRAIESEGYSLDRFRFPWVDSGSSPGSAPKGSPHDSRHERQPGTILFRIDRQGPKPGQPAPPQELLLLLLVGETPTAGIHQEAFATSLNIAWTLDAQRNADDTDTTREPAIRILGPTFSGTADSLARVLRTWTALDAKRRDAHVWVCSGAATAIDKPSFESNALPAHVTYAATVIPDDILLGELFHYLANPAGLSIPRRECFPMARSLS